ncbi:hypothetical protein N7456_002243 [Penicillium angulare]|uniref:Rhodopsin domain-containing protein n=1 Tax=Penicillium angulare TaxID=116970 RepID=A0A9W9G7Q5_9EURO|nr:hypothetical protein N7456_002243 [Penicillium angulare]
MHRVLHSGQQNLGALSSMLAISGIAVFLRFAVRISTKQGIRLSDWLILLSLMMMSAYAGVMIQCKSSHKLLVEEEALEGHPDWMVTMLKAIYVCELTFIATLTVVKLSILAFYHSIFSISTTFKLCVKLAFVLSLMWGIIGVFVEAFQCKPVSALWNDMGSAEYCLAAGRIWLGLEITNLFGDVAILAMPLFMIKQLNLPRNRKYSLGGIFLLGSLACVCSIVKLSFLWNPNNPYLSDVSPTMIWSSIQLGTSILCACLPTLTPLLRLVREKLGMSTTRSSTTEKAKKMTPNQSSMNYSNADPSSYHRMQEDESVYRANVSSDSRELEQLDSTSHNSIQVNKTVEIV